MKKLKLGLIGAGNIIKTRHLPALLKNKDLFEIIGIVDVKGENSKNLAEKFNIQNFSKYTKYDDLDNLTWFKNIDAVIIGIPPKEHYAMVKKCLLLGKHVLVEKPFVVNLEEGKELIKLAKTKKLVLAVNHNFQFSNAFSKLDKVIKTGKIGKIRSIYGTQFSNDTRRLPIWCEELPLGLFYDESPHFFYLLNKYAGKDLILKNVFCNKSKIKDSTPQSLSIELVSNNIPISIYLNFESPICEWYFCVIGEKSMAVVDLFRDILIVLPNDGQHLGKEVMTTSILTTWQHWNGVVTNGFAYLIKKLFYGFTATHKNFYDAILNKKQSCLKGMSAEDGLNVNIIQHLVVKKTL